MTGASRGVRRLCAVRLCVVSARFELIGTLPKARINLDDWAVFSTVPCKGV